MRGPSVEHRVPYAMLTALLLTIPYARSATPPTTAPPPPPEAAPAETPPAAAPAVLEYHRGRLTIDVAAMPLAEFFDALEHATGVQIDSRIQHWDPITATFADVPLSIALERLLGPRSFLLTYGRHGAPQRLTIFARALPPTVARAAARPGAITNLAIAVARQPPVELPAALQDLFPRGRPSLLQLMGRTRSLTDARLRQLALQTISQTLTAAPPIRAALQATAPDDLSRLVAGWMGPHADALLGLMSNASDPLVRGRAALARQRLATAGRR